MQQAAMDSLYTDSYSPSTTGTGGVSHATIVSGAKASSGSIRLSLCGREWELQRPADLETLWESITDEAFTDDERLPYWVELWPASLSLAVWLWRNKERISGKACLDIGCGLGFTALVASWLGAKVIGMDYEAEALSYASRNAAVNAVSAPCWTVMDWRSPAIQPKSCAFLWGGDIMYESRFVGPVFDFLEHSLAPEGCVWLAEPGRNVFATFKQTLAERGWKARCIAKDRVEPLHVQKSMVSVNLWELVRG